MRGWALWDGPAFQHTIHLEPQIVVEPAGAVLLNDKTRPYRRAAAAKRLWGALRVALYAVQVQLGGRFHLVERYRMVYYGFKSSGSRSLAEFKVQSSMFNVQSPRARLNPS